MFSFRPLAALARSIAPLCLVVAPLVSACGAFLPQGPTMAQVDQAYGAGNRAQLQSWCDDIRARSQSLSRSASNDDVRAAGAAACQRAEALQEAGQAQQYLSSLNCDNAVESFEAFARGAAERDTQEAFAASGRTLAGCGRFDVLFGRLLARPVQPVSDTPAHRYGYRLLATLADQGTNIEAEIVRFTAESDFRFDGARYTADAMVTFLLERQVGGDCARFLRPLASDQPATLTRWMDYYAATECRAAAAPVARLMAMDVPNLRALVCQTLGRVGGPAERRLMTQTARQDPASTQVGLRVVYPVREACERALTVLRAR